ncbi:MAG: type III secretion system chaperone [Chlamydiota bacterium]
MSLQNADKNIQELAKSLKLEIPSILETKMCALQSEDGMVLHFFYEENGDFLYLYAPLLTVLPKEDSQKAKLYEELLQAQLLFSGVSDGKIGIDKKQGILFFYEPLTMKEEGEKVLAEKFPTFFRMSMAWKELVDKTLGTQPPKKTQEPVRPINPIKL